MQLLNEAKNGGKKEVEVNVTTLLFQYISR